MTKRSCLVGVLLIMLILTACSVKSQKERDDFIGEVVDLAAKLKNDEPIELSTLYDSLVSELPVDSLETLVLAEELKRKGFRVVNWGRGNFPPHGVRIVILSLAKDDCYCTVSKMYYSTTQQDLYQIHESISCKDSVIASKTRPK
jgi:hypothetical protein